MRRPTLHVRRGFVAAGVLALSGALGGCAHAPGMSLDTQSEAARARIDYRVLDRAAAAAQRAVRRGTEPVLASAPAAFAEPGGPWQYTVAPQDVLRITVWEHPELTNPSGTTDELSGRVVNADGRLYFPYAGQVQAAGRSVQEIRDALARGLSSVIKSPKVDVAVLQYRGQRVLVSGQVRTPGVQPVTDVPPDLADMIARAGGTTDEADLSRVLVTRGGERAVVDLEAMYYRGDTRANLRLRHGDIVNVPERRNARVFVTGEVVRPLRLVMPRGELTLADALAEAGGLNLQSANAAQIFVIRGDEGDKPVVWHLNATTPEALLLADEFTLRSRDVVYVDAAPVVRWGRLMSNIVPSATLLRETLNDSTRALPR